VKIGCGSSKEKETELALQEAYRKSLQKLGATRSDLSFVFFSYDYAMDPTALSNAAKRVFRDVPHFGGTVSSASFQRDGFELETGLLVVSFKDLGFEFDFLKVHSLKEKAELWAMELSRQIQDRALVRERPCDFVFFIADSLNFTCGNGFASFEKNLPELQICGIGASYSVPQVSLLCKGEVYSNALVALEVWGAKPWVGLTQNIRPELNPIDINRMSENLVIEIDQKPAFYKLCEHLMTKDDLPMMSQDQFRRHMGDLYVVEVPKVQPERTRSLAEPYSVVSLLGSEMTTGMVAVGHELDFTSTHYIGQKKVEYAEAGARDLFQKLKTQIEKPSFLWLSSSMARLRDRDRKNSDQKILRDIFPDTPILELASNGEFLGVHNQFALIVIAFA
jgi:hypothetical protein